jgi:hypothetical protein
MEGKIVKQEYECPFPLAGPTSVASGREYTLMGKAEALQFRQLTDSLSGWVLRADSSNVFVWDRETKNGTLIKVFATYDCAPSLMWDMLHDAVFRVVWDDSRLDSYRIVMLNERNDIGYYAAKSPMVVSHRDFLNQRSWHNAGNGEYVIFNTSVQHSACEEKEGFVRAISKVSGYLIRPWGASGCSLTYLTMTDPKGWIPAMVVNFVTTTFAPTKMSKIRKAANDFKTWMGQQKAYVKDWEVPVEPWDSPQQDETHAFVERRLAKGDLRTPVAASPTEEDVFEDQPI